MKSYNILSLIALAFLIIEIIYLQPSRFSMLDYWIITGITGIIFFCLELKAFFVMDALQDNHEVSNTLDKKNLKVDSIKDKGVKE